MAGWIRVFAALLLGGSASTYAQDSINFETGPVRPLVIGSEGSALYAVNTPDGRLEIFDLTGGEPVLTGSVPVGLEPVAVAMDGSRRAWVVNHLSDSVSVVDVQASPPHVIATLLVGDEPRDIVFAGERAFIATAHRGQNTADPTGAYNSPGQGRADVWVFESTDLSRAPQIVNLFGDVPRALAVSPDGSRVYASVFLSGNRTTTIGEGTVCDGGARARACATGPGGLPVPNRSHTGEAAPEVGLIVRDRGEGFVDELGRDWSDAVRFDLPDYDVFAIDARAATPARVERYSGVGTVNFAMAVHPVSGEVFVANTEALNEVRFEGSGEFARAEGAPGRGTLRGHLHESRITVIDPAGDVSPVHLNPHIDYQAESYGPDVRWRTLAQPVALAIDGLGETLYVAAFGSSTIGVLSVAELQAGEVSSALERVISLRDPWPGGPAGLVLDEARQRLYVSNRFDNSLAVVDLVARAEVARLPMHTPEPAVAVVGRPALYDALATSAHGEAACGSCHVFGDFDGLAWDRGDPDGDTLSNPNPRGPIGGDQPFHPMKGPMTTQSFRGMSNHGPMHWRGDRTGGYDGDALDEQAAFEAFNGAFEGLLGRSSTLTEEEMARFARFALTIHYPPNPIRNLDNSLRANEARGENDFQNLFADPVATCEGCHRHDRESGFFGSDGRTTFEGETQDMKVAHLRNLYQKVGMFGMAESSFFDDGAIGHEHMGPQIRGFGFLHDGSTDTVLRFFTAGVFSGFGSLDRRRDMEAFMMAFDSEFAPVVGAQGAERAGLLESRARADFILAGGGRATECDLVAHAPFRGRLWSLLYDGANYVPDSAAVEPLSRTMLEDLAEGPVTYTCWPPGTGQRALDRDGDGALNADDPEPATRAPIAIPNIPVPPPDPVDPGMDAGPGFDAGPVTDGGPGPDAGPGPGEDAGPTMDGALPEAGADMGGGGGGGDGCGCRVGVQRDRRGAALALLIPLLVLWRRRR
ncbi:MAG: hypothetical protein AAF938_20000 [Myxococcota bacterium]